MYRVMMYCCCKCYNQQCNGSFQKIIGRKLNLLLALAHREIIFTVFVSYSMIPYLCIFYCYVAQITWSCDEFTNTNFFKQYLHYVINYETQVASIIIIRCCQATNLSTVQLNLNNKILSIQERWQIKMTSVRRVGIKAQSLVSASSAIWHYVLLILFMRQKWWLFKSRNHENGIMVICFCYQVLFVGNMKLFIILIMLF
jgi:hypothetical protein